MKLYKFTEVEKNQVTIEIKKISGIPSSFEFSYLEDDGFYYTSEEFKNRIENNGVNLDNIFNTLFAQNFQAYCANKTINEFRIIDLVNDHFKEHRIENVDFKTHTKSNVALDKSTRKFSNNGRPEFVEYTYQGQKIARREFFFESDPETNFLTKRTEKLAYYRSDDTLGDFFIIKEKNYDLSKDGDLIMKERTEARSKIINDVKGVVISALGIHHGQNKTYQENLHEASSFFKSYANDISLFIETGVAKKTSGVENYLLDNINADAVTLLLNYPTYGILGVGTELLTIREAINVIVDY